MLAKSLLLKNLKLITDTKPRDLTSLERLLRGFLGNESLRLDAPPVPLAVQKAPLLFSSFAPFTGPKLCAPPEAQQVRREKLERFQRLEMPMGVGLPQEMNATRFVEVLKELQELIGRGVAGPLEELPKPKERPLSYGVLGVLKIFPEDLMHSFASGELLFALSDSFMIYLSL